MARLIMAIVSAVLFIITCLIVTFIDKDNGDENFYCHWAYFASGMAFMFMVGEVARLVLG